MSAGRLRDEHYRYIDVQGAEAYERHAGQEFEVSELVTGSPSAVFDAWIHDVWLAGLPEESAQDQEDSSTKISSICYRVRKPGPFPLESHLAMVRFVDAGDPADRTPKTLVIWTVKTEMSRACNWLHCGGLVRLIFRTALKTFLRSLAKEAAKK
ncbi:hypothetical protein PR003_g19338 [Phytophthora rubi]|uniref:START domain-containing protein n=1 Tax=Phytophthora rubi TaxID=129364 RepID=A0A6A4DWK8_9STRA|nr:hypothetical protein PR003_g19338 [Phytophthora rubi]